MSFTFVSCGDDDDDDNNSGLYAGSPIVGSWTWSKDKGDEGSMTYTFNANGTFTWTDEDSDGVETEKGTFQYDGGSTLILITSDGTEELNVKVVANSYIVIHETKFYKK